MEQHITPSLEQLRMNVCRTYAGLGKHTPQSVLRMEGSMWTCESPFEHPIGNFACHLDASEFDIERLVAMALARPHVRIYQMAGDSPTDLRQRLIDGGLTERYQLSGMVFEATEVEPWDGLAPAETVREVNAVAQFMVDTFFWRSKREIRGGLAEILAASAADGQQFYWARDGDVPIAAATLFLTDGVAGIYNLCVKVEERGRGLGAAAVRQLVSLARGAEMAAFLQCDPALADWYVRLGFKEGTRSTAFSS